MGDWCHIGQYCQLSQAARIGRGVFMGGQTVFSDNRKAVQNVDEDLYGAVVEDYVRIGLNCTILPAIRIGISAFIGAGSVVTKNITRGVLAYGNPARVSRPLTEQETQEYISSVER